jgi:hypothetical membrane protein
MDNNAISDLAAMGTRTTLIEEMAILGLAVCWLLGSYFLFRRARRSLWLAVLNFSPGLGFLVAGLSRERKCDDTLCGHRRVPAGCDCGYP